MTFGSRAIMARPEEKEGRNEMAYRRRKASSRRSYGRSNSVARRGRRSAAPARGRKRTGRSYARAPAVRIEFIQSAGNPVTRPGPVTESRPRRRSTF